MSADTWDSETLRCPECDSELVKIDWDLPEEDKSINMISMKVQFLVDPLQVKARCPECDIEYKAKYELKEIMSIE
ncbi:MAG: hypothetical protein V5A88_03695 [Candidatus Thermoplasmatota archaeon]